MLQDLQAIAKLYPSSQLLLIKKNNSKTLKIKRHLIFLLLSIKISSE